MNETEQQIVDMIDGQVDQLLSIASADAPVLTMLNQQVVILVALGRAIRQGKHRG